MLRKTIKSETCHHLSNTHTKHEYKQLHEPVRSNKLVLPHVSLIVVPTDSPHLQMKLPVTLYARTLLYFFASLLIHIHHHRRTKVSINLGMRQMPNYTNIILRAQIEINIRRFSENWCFLRERVYDWSSGMSEVVMESIYLDLSQWVT